VGEAREVLRMPLGLQPPVQEPVPPAVLMSAAETIDLEIQRLKVSVLETTKRVAILENMISDNACPKTARKTRSKKTSS
jgi:hypothetical protein